MPTSSAILSLLFLAVAAVPGAGRSSEPTPTGDGERSPGLGSPASLEYAPVPAPADPDIAKALRPALRGEKIAGEQCRRPPIESYRRWERSHSDLSLPMSWSGILTSQRPLPGRRPRNGVLLRLERYQTRWPASRPFS